MGCPPSPALGHSSSWFSALRTPGPTPGVGFSPGSQPCTYSRSGDFLASLLYEPIPIINFLFYVFKYTSVSISISYCFCFSGKVKVAHPWNSPGQKTGVGGLSLLHGIFPTQGSNLGLPHCRQIFYQLSHKGSPRTLINTHVPKFL